MRAGNPAHSAGLTVGMLICAVCSVAAGAETTGTARWTSTGILDNTFGGNGRVTGSTSATAESHAVAVYQSKVIAGGSFVGSDGVTHLLLGRFTSTGSPDPNFGFGGATTATFGGNECPIAALGVDNSNGKILVLCQTSIATDIFIARFNTNGSVDTTFGGSGTGFINPFGGGYLAIALRVASDGNIFALAQIPNHNFVVGRFTSAGVTSYLTQTTFDGSLADSRVRDIAVDSVDRAVIVGEDSSGHVAALRLASAGFADSAWGSNGVVSLDFGLLSQFGTGVAIDGSGRTIIVGGTSPSQTNARFLMARLTTSGGVDGSYKNIGTITGTTGDFANWKVLVGTDGKYYVGGGVYFGSNNTNLQFTILKVLSTSFSPDPGFGTNGFAHTGFTGYSFAEELAMALDSSDNRPVQTGNIIQ